MSPANAAYHKRWKLDHERGLKRLVPAGPVVAHVAELEAAGFSRRSVAAAAGTSSSGVYNLMTGRSATMQSRIAAQLMAVTPASIMARRDADGFVLAIGARRRIRALLALGWTHAHITAAAGGPLSAVTLNQTGEWITRATHDAYRAAYAELSMRPGPSAKTRGRAAKAGYAPPLAWDDDALDDPTAPEPARSAASARPSATERLDEWLELVRGGEEPARAAARAGYTAVDGIDAVRDHATRVGHTAVLNWLDVRLTVLPGRDAVADAAVARFRARRAKAAA